MKKRLLLTLSLFSLAFAQAQKNSSYAYAITGLQKGGSGWTEVRLIDLTTGEEKQSVFQSAADAEIFNARTGKPVEKSTDGKLAATDKPFATTSAACAYDKKHNRLYYTPMGIAQLRYIDLKAKSPRVYYFQDEAFGALKSRHDVSNQITRMVIGKDGSGYALTNDAAHLIRFATNKKAEITDLGTLTDDPTNGERSVHSRSNQGGDMIAGKDGELYLIGANRSVYKIDIASKVASYMGSIKGLPRGFSTNGAVAQGGTTVVVSSSSNTQGYYRFNLATLQAEKISGEATVYNASDLAGAELATDEEKKADEPVQPPVAQAVAPVKSMFQPETTASNAVSIYPNPVTENYFRVTFSGAFTGRHQIQLLDLAGKVISGKTVVVTGKGQVEEFRLGQKLSAGNYYVRVTSDDGQFSESKKIVVQQ